jgi:hypothetical protein
LLDDVVATTAAAIPGKGFAISGTDGTNARVIKTDTSGELQIDVLTQPALSHSTDSLKIGDGTEFLSITALNQAEVAVTSALPAGTNAIGKLAANDGVDIGDVTINNASGASAVNIQDGGNSITVDGTVAATQSGTWNINNVSGTVSLPTGASTLAEQQTQTTSLQLIDDTVATTGAAITAKGLASVGTDGTNARIIKTDSSGELQIDVLTQPARSHSTDSFKVGDGTEFLSITASNQAEVAVTAALPAGTNAIGKLAANDGIDIGDVTINNAAGASAVNIQDGGNSITVDGTIAATQSGTWNVNNVSGTVSLPTGASTLAEQQTQTTSLQLIDDTVATVAAAITTKGIAAIGTDGTNARILKTDSSGELQIDCLTEPATVADGGALPSVVKVIGGYDGANVQAVLTSASGALQVDVLSGAGSGTQYTEGDTDASITGTAMLWEDTGDTLRAVSAAKPLPVSDAGGSLTVDGTVTIQDGGNVISIDDAGGSITVDGSVTIAALDVVDLFDTPLLDTSSSNIPGSGGGFLQVVASLAAAVKKIQILDTTGAFVGVYTGAASSEVLKFVFGPGSDQTVEVSIASSTRISLRRLDSATAVSSGFVSMNFMG